MNIAQKKALAFIRKYRLKKKTFDLSTMRDIFKRQGFVLLRYNKHGKSTDNVETILKGLNLKEQSQITNGFIFVNSTDKLVCTSNTLSEDEELYILLHEQGHRVCNHLGVGLPCDVVIHEEEANAFAFYVMHYINLKEKFRSLFLMGGVLLIAFYLVMLLVLLMR